MEEKNKSESNWNEVKGGEVFSFDKEGDSFEGKLADVRSNIGENNSMMYDLESAGKLHSIWGATVLDGKMRRVKIGDFVKIVFLGEKPSVKRKGRTYKDYQVFIRESKEESQASL